MLQDIDPANTTAQAWTLSYVWESVIWQTFSTNIYASSGSYLGVASTDLTLEFLTRVLTAQSAQLQYDNYIYAFEIGANGEVCLGSSDGVDLYLRDSSNEPQRSLTLHELAAHSKPMAALHGLLAGPEWNGSVAAFATAQAKTETPALVDFGGTTQLLCVSEIRHGNIYWVIVQFLNEAQVLANLTAGSRETGGIVASLVVSAVALAMGSSVSLTRVLRMLRADIEELRALKFRDVLGRNLSFARTTKNQSRISEV
ncbi:hypothetical protein BDK51DRAFT_45288 [Blyttiomyces helicus]|uniref:Uncharacterized protein n=1 Tax=Blyttiomyces helicus TaxID=388810 RepID=A0A4P9WFK6_9FUNG|nr:hypothetical protein BDK51DRAFT_45288 [Blyttiomyces helicus]|eukprot:RKO90543.1 hypothetical protein BDK51DRAFT_45288 [Blyttiomyces helicus]